jgi:hypothetical protein
MNKENVPHTGGEPVLRRKRSVFGGREKEKERDKENKRESTYATVSSGAERERERKSVYGTFDEPLDTQFKNVPGGLSDGNRRARREYLLLLFLFGFRSQPAPFRMRYLPHPRVQYSKDKADIQLRPST